MSIAQGSDDGPDLKSRIEAEYAREDGDVSEADEEMTLSIFYTLTCYYC